MYQCQVVHEFDKDYIISSVTMANYPSMFPMNPRADLIACNQDIYDPKHHIFTLNSRQEACLRCRGFGYPRPTVAIYKGEHELEHSDSISVKKYINVADGGIPEATYTFRSPSGDIAGDYSCKVTNDQGSDQIHVKIRYRTKPYG